MITLEKLDIYEKYGGDIDGLIRIGSDAEKIAINDSDWWRISEVVSALLIIRRGLASDDFARRNLADIKSECENSEVFNRLEKLAKQRGE